MRAAIFAGHPSLSIVSGEITDREVQFWRKDLKQKRRVLTRYSVEEFVATLAEHGPDHYRHAIRYFGLLAARFRTQTSAALFALLGPRSAFVCEG